MLQTSLSSTITSSDSNKDNLEQYKKDLLNLIESEGLILVEEAMKEIPVDYNDFCLIVTELRDSEDIEGDHLMGSNALKYVGDSSLNETKNVELSKDTLRKAYKIRNIMNESAKALGEDRFSLDEIFSNALYHYSDFKEIDV